LWSSLTWCNWGGAALPGAIGVKKGENNGHNGKKDTFNVGFFTK